MDVKERAVELRLQGKTYKEIADILDGVSVDWCKRNLKGLKPKAQGVSEEALQEVINLAIRPEGCTNYELNAVLFKYFEKGELKGDYMQGYKRRAKYRNSDCVFRPGWISKTLPKHSQTLLYSMASDLFERFQEAVADYTDTFPDTDKKAVLMELVKISNGHLNPEGLEKRLERNNDVVFALEERLKQDAQ